MLSWISVVPPFLIFSCITSLLLVSYMGPRVAYEFAMFAIINACITTSHELVRAYTTNKYTVVNYGRICNIGDSVEFNLIFLADELTLILSLVVMILTALALTFGVEYMTREAFITRVLYLLMCFATSVVCLFTVYDLFLVVIMWELIGIFSYLLVKFYSQRIYIVKASFKVIVFSRISDLFLMLVFFLSIKIFSSTDMAAIFVYAPYFSQHYLFIKSIGFSFIWIYSMLIAASGIVKAAQIFTHTWLPDAMQAPTPASALIHSSTLVVMGIYLMIRFQVFFEFSPGTNYYVSLTGATSIGFGAFVATYQQDAKKLVAYSTISQMGYLVCGCGLLAYEEVLIYLVVHAINKAFLFIVVGYSVHFFQSNTDLRQMTSTKFYSSDIALFLLLTTFNLMGLPYAAGFYSKEFLVDRISLDGFVVFWVRAMWWVSFICTPIYMFKLAEEIVFKWRRLSSSTLWEVLLDYINMYWNILLEKTWNDVIFGSKLIVQRALFTGRATLYTWILFTIYIHYGGEWLVLYVYEIINPMGLTGMANLNMNDDAEILSHMTDVKTIKVAMYGSILIFTQNSINRMFKYFYKNRDYQIVVEYLTDVGFLIGVVFILTDFC